MISSLMVVILSNINLLKSFASSVRDEHSGRGLMLFLASRAFVMLNTSLAFEAFSVNNRW